MAGSILAWQLIQSGKKTLVIDDGKRNASQVAAGLVNPITGKRLLKSNNCDRFLTSAKASYIKLSQHLNREFYVEMDMLRILKNQDQVDLAQKRLADLDFAPYLNYPTQKYKPRPNAPFGILYQKQTAYVKTKQLLESLQHFFVENKHYLKKPLDYNSIQLHTDSVSWNGISAAKMIFCEGHHAEFNPFFNYLPFQSAKGEILTLNLKQPITPVMWNYGFWAIPTQDNCLRTGATFEPNYSNNQPNPNNKKILMDALVSVLPDIKLGSILDHLSGIRPCTLDKQPFIGMHPKYPMLAIFNGFGAKGCLQIPWYSRQFCQYLLKSSKLPAYCDIYRYEQTHFFG